MVSIWIPIMMFATIGVVFVTLFINAAKKEESRQRTLQRAVENGQQLTPELVETLGKSVDPVPRDYRRGVVITLFGIAVLIFGLAIDFGGKANDVVPYLSIFPILVGVGYLFVWKTQGGENN